jgi:hypothetical protein
MITPTIAWLVALAAVIPAAASASPLLSGYGGPGEGSQVILGSSLLGGGGGGGGSSQNTGAPTGTGGSSKAGTGNLSTRSRRSLAGGHGKRATGPVGGASPSGSQVYPASARGAASREAGASDTLGLSGENLMYILLALAALIFTGVLTRRMARTTAASRHG